MSLSRFMNKMDDKMVKLREKALNLRSISATDTKGTDMNSKPFKGTRQTKYLE